MKKQIAYNPYGFHQEESRFKKLTRIAVWGGSVASLILFLFGYQLLVANRAPRALSLIVSYLSEGISVVALFTLLALLVLTVSHEETALRKSLLLSETIALFSLSVVLRMLLYFLTAVIDNTGILGDFYLNDVTLFYLTFAGGFRLIMNTLSSLFGVLMILVVLLVSTWLVKKEYQKGERGKLSHMMAKLPLLTYLALSVGSALINTVMSIIDIGIALDATVIFTLLLPYIEIAVYTVIGHFVMQEVIKLFEN